MKKYIVPALCVALVFGVLVSVRAIGDKKATSDNYIEPSSTSVVASNVATETVRVSA